MAELPIALAELPGAKITARVNRTAGAAVNDQTTVTIIESLTRNVDGLNICMKKLLENPKGDLDQIDHRAGNSVGITNTKNSHAKKKSHGSPIEK